MAIREPGSFIKEKNAKPKPNGKPTQPHPRPTARDNKGQALDGSDNPPSAAKEPKE